MACRASKPPRSSAYWDCSADRGRRPSSSELERICGTLEIAAPAPRLREIAATHEYESVPSNKKGESKEIRSADPGSWQEHLSAAEQQAMYEVMGETLADVGYLPGSGGQWAA